MKEESKIKSFVLKTISMIINDKIMSRIFYKFGGLSVGFLRAQLLCSFIFLNVNVIDCNSSTLNEI